MAMTDRVEASWSWSRVSSGTPAAFSCISRELNRKQSRLELTPIWDAGATVPASL